MIKTFSRFTALMAFSLAVLFFTSFHSQASVGDIFTIDQLKYTVLSEDNTTQTGTVSVEAESKDISGDITIPSSIEKDGYTYSVTIIPDSAFKECKKLTVLTVPNGITSIGKGAFASCYKLEKAVLPDSVTSIGQFAFFKCLSLKEITLPSKTATIERGTFMRCMSLSYIEIPEGVTEIKSLAFCGCRLNHVTIPDSVTSLSATAFVGCDMLSVSIPAELKLKPFNFNFGQFGLFCTISRRKNQSEQKRI